jgi:hypothetical protein
MGFGRQGACSNPRGGGGQPPTLKAFHPTG